MISGPSSYVPTLNEFLAHWSLVDTQLGVGNELKLVNAENRGNLATERDALEGLRDEVTDANVDRAQARAEITALVTLLHGHLVEFNKAVRAYLPASSIADILPDAFAVGDAEGSVRDALRVVSRLWGKVNALTSTPGGLTLPLVLVGGVTVQAFDTKRDELRLAYRDYSDAVVDLREARKRRDKKQSYVYELLKQYRMIVPTKFVTTHELVASLPKLTPAEGHTPATVTAQAEWVPAQAKSKVTWTESTDTDLDRYEVRAVPGDDYESEDEVVLATVPAGGVREMLTDFALNAPGITVGYKVYVVLSTGNESGSSPVFVTRPA